MTSHRRNIYVACGYTDLRKGIDGFALLVKEECSLDPFSRKRLFLWRLRIMPVQRPSFIPRKLRGFTESLYSPNTSHKSQLPNTLPCSTTAKGFIRHAAIYPRVSSKPITIFQGSTCPPKLDQISSLLALMNRKSMNTSPELFWKSHFKRKCMSIICTMSHWSWFS